MSLWQNWLAEGVGKQEYAYLNCQQSKDHLFGNSNTLEKNCVDVPYHNHSIEETITLVLLGQNGTEQTYVTYTVHYPIPHLPTFIRSIWHMYIPETRSDGLT